MAESRPVEADFLQFLSGMAMQTLVHLGAIENPITKKTSRDPANAKYSIDILGVLQAKTKGNLTAEEERYLQAALTDLRMRYVAVTEAGGDA